MTRPRVLITGATGFVGAKLLEARDPETDVRVVVRDAARLGEHEGVDVVEGDLADADVLARALEDRDLAYYLVHSMEPGADFATRDRELAEGFVAAAGEAGVGRIAYLGGIDPGGETSEHLQSRLEVEEIFDDGEPDLVSVRATMIVGAKSDSFRTLAQIVRRLPALVLPTWRDTRLQPVAIADVVAALWRAHEVPPGRYDIAGPDERTLEQIIGIIGEFVGGERPSVDVPFSSSKLESLVSSLVADSDREVLEPLMAGLHEDLVVRDNALESVFGVTPTPFREAAAAALDEDGDAAPVEA